MCVGGGGGGGGGGWGGGGGGGGGGETEALSRRPYQGGPIKEALSRFLKCPIAWLLGHDSYIAHAYHNNNDISQNYKDGFKSCWGLSQVQYTQVQIVDSLWVQISTHTQLIVSTASAVVSSILNGGGLGLELVARGGLGLGLGLVARGGLELGLVARGGLGLGLELVARVG